uniref:intronic ORF at intron 1 of cob n=1 Tax=Moniliophthora perniciosa TaxID=153609 RepID=UPI000024237E|nr:intronic ORF at intron 1 of cob [Moniliophthora perniciosa]AAQ74275.1 intronic ORF at intron 1 of cob [Moniliophthora perniciosa]
MIFLEEIVYTSLNPWFVTGLVDAEGSFSFSISKDNNLRFGWRISPLFNITMSIRDSSLLKEIKSFFKVGDYRESEDFCYYRARSIESVNEIIKHFDLYPPYNHLYEISFIFLYYYLISIKIKNT